MGQLENEQLDICLKVLGIAASRLDAVTKSRVDAGESEIRSVTTEYYLLRIQLSWLQGRPDIAEHLLSKVPESRTKVDEENVLETCYRIGKLALSDASYDTAAKWLGRALASSDALSRDSDLASKETRFLVLHAEYAKEFPALMMQLEIFSKDEEPNCSRYFRVLKDAIQMVELTDENLEM
ncbi:hypothetical protein PHISCL_05712 [Aspergillus sclerotialis]|uniref:Protein ZIP4 homolog n=1 Tax=Aspergillus sclerotialis TaxID=2070753 RepID=A0A3A2ZHH0_9EURO|nr:hypothetical protein PHISCL_05712 [Aspergillus sclerotialis]